MSRIGNVKNEKSEKRRRKTSLKGKNMFINILTFYLGRKKSTYKNTSQHLIKEKNLLIHILIK